MRACNKVAAKMFSWSECVGVRERMELCLWLAHTALPGLLASLWWTSGNKEWSCGRTMRLGVKPKGASLLRW
jgi:hypothetical protein